jgi:hypothetical protein
MKCDPPIEEILFDLFFGRVGLCRDTNELGAPDDNEKDTRKNTDHHY